VKIKAQIEALEKLAALDAEIAALDEELAAQRETLGQRKDELTELEAKLVGSQASLEGMERMRNELVQEARQMSSQMDRSREKLGRCRTEKEVNAAQREIDELRKLYRDREQEAEKIAGLIDQARTEITETATRRDAISGELGESEGAVTTKLQELEAASQEKASRRGEHVKGILPQVFRRYEMIRKRKGSAVAHVTDGTCSACHIRIMPMMFQQMMRGDAFEQCPNCNRIIYFRPVDDGDVVDGSAGA
jgi:uncharacterized protein